jgi:hypothetical protein
MFDADLTPPVPPADDDPAVLRAEQRLGMLRELAEIGMELARALRPGAAATSEPPVDDKCKGRDPAEAFGVVSRAVRLTLALEDKIDAELRDLKAGIVRERADEQVRAEKRAEVAADEAEDARVRRVSELVISVAEAEIGDIESFDNFHEALEERLEEDEAYMDCIEKPLRETVERLCNDLGLHPDWSRWDGEGWAEDYAPLRPRCSIFNQPSPRPLLRVDPPGTPRAAPSQPLNGSHDLE